MGDLFLSEEEDLTHSEENDNLFSNKRNNKLDGRSKDSNLNILGIYIKSIGNSPLLTREEEQDLGRKIKEAYSTLFCSICSYNRYAHRRELPFGLVLFREELGFSPDKTPPKKEEEEPETVEELEDMEEVDEYPSSKKEEHRKFEYGFLDLEERIIRYRSLKVRGSYLINARPSEDLSNLYHELFDLIYTSHRRELYSVGKKVQSLAFEEEKAVKDYFNSVYRKPNKNIFPLNRLCSSLVRTIAKINYYQQNFIASTLPLPIKIAKKYLNLGLPFLDLIQEGNIGIITAVEKFDHTYGNKFSTYAVWWVEQKISQAVGNKARTIRIPVCTYKTAIKVDTVRYQLVGLLGREPTSEEIAEKLKLSTTIVEKIMRKIMPLIKEPLSLYLPLRGDGEAALGDKIGTRNTEREIDRLVNNQYLNHYIDQLPERTARVLRCRTSVPKTEDYDLKGWDEPLTLEETGALFPSNKVNSDRETLTRERVRQIENEAKKRLAKKMGIKLRKH